MDQENFKTMCNPRVYHGLQNIVISLLSESIHKSAHTRNHPIKTNWHPYPIGIGGIWNCNITDSEHYFREHDHKLIYWVTVEFETFHGAHGSPYYRNIATYDILNLSPLQAKEIAFLQYEIPELSEFQSHFQPNMT